MKWISVKEAVPGQVENKHGDLIYPDVLIWAPKYPDQIVGRYRAYNKTWTFSGSNSDFTDEITHWMYRPDPPRICKHCGHPIEWDNCEVTPDWIHSGERKFYACDLANRDREDVDSLIRHYAESAEAI
jgi:hypothetical protein